MARGKNLLPSKRRVTILIGFFLLLTVLFSLFQFYYVPSNRDKLHQYGFMLLNRVKMNISERDNDLRRYYSNIVEKQLNNKKQVIQADLLKKKFTDRFITYTAMQECMGTSVLSGNTNDSCVGYGFIKEQNDWIRLYNFRNDHQSDSFGLGLPVRSFLEPAFSYRKELFESYFVINNCGTTGTVLYHDEKLGVGEKVMQDSSLVKAMSHNISQILDIRLKGVNYKMFTYPFEMGQQSLVLCGMVKATEYNNSLRNIPAGLIYPVLILILVLLVALPFVKPYMLSPQEKLNITDLYLMGIALFAGLTLITLLVIQALILGATTKKEKRELKQLAQHLETSFLKEIDDASRQLTYFDSTLYKWKNNDTTLTIARSTINLPGLQKVPFLHGGDPFYLPIQEKRNVNPYYFLERAVWIDGKGEQTIKAQVDTISGYQFINVSERNYFRLLNENRSYLRPGNNRSPFVIDPIYSWTAGDFKVNISQKSIFNSMDTAMYVVLVSRFSSLVETVFPVGYGYCLIDKEGNVLTHSDKDRNLRENFLDETGRPRLMVETIASRQASYVNRMMMYGRPYAMYVSPVKDLPFHLVVFHDKTYRIPINLRILAFSLVFILVFYIIAFCAVFLFRNIFGFKLQYSVFRPSIAYREWMLPSSERNRFYVSAIEYIAFYVFLFLMFCVFWEKFRTDNFVTLIVTLLSPINLIASLFLLERVLREDGNTNNEKTFFTGWAVFIVLILACMFGIPFDNGKQRFQFFLFESCWIILPLAIWFFKRKKMFYVIPHKYEKIPRQTYLGSYSWFVMALIISFTILPASIFTWFAHNYEIRQSVKKQQLSLATSLADRRDGLIKFFQHHDDKKLPASFFDYAQYRAGVYTVYDDSVFEVNEDLKNQGEIAGFLQQTFIDTIEQRKLKKSSSRQLFSCFDESELFYLDLADALSRNYNDPSFYPALSDKSTDTSWYWFSAGQSVYFYKKYPYSSSWPGYQPLVKGMMIHSKLPPRFELLSSWSYRLFIILFTIGLVWLLVKLIKVTAARVFLPDHTLSPLKACKVSIKAPLKNRMEEQAAETERVKMNNLFIQSEETEARISGKPYLATDTQYFSLKYDSNLPDEELMDLVDKNEKVFDRIWDNMSDKQKLLLLDMAQDGLVNYRNTDEIRDLCGKGVLIISEDRMQLFSYAFGYYLRSRKSGLKKELDKKFDQTGTWAAFRTPLIVIILSFAVFIFATQEDIWNKVIGLVGSLTAILTLLQRFIFNKESGKE